MRINGKIIGLLIGLGFFPLGPVIGLFIGHMFDRGYFHRLFAGASTTKAGGQAYTSTQQIFFDTSFAIMGYIAKADGRVSVQEIQLAERIMAEMHLTGERRAHAIAMFQQGKAPGFDYRVPLAQLRRVAWFQPGLMRMFLDIQIQVALVNGSMVAPSRAALRNVFLGLGYPERVFNVYERQFSQAERGGYRGFAGNAQASAVTTDQDYALLGLTQGASAAEVKKAYRRKMSKHHPDRLIAKGMPPEMVKLATQKTQNIKQAYERIKASGVSA
jgi:DnaJ like chaperone protein